MKQSPFYPPHPARSAFRLGRLLSPLYLRRAYGLQGVTEKNTNNLLRALQEFSPRHRLILLFRHTSAADAPALIHQLLRFPDCPAGSRPTGDLPARPPQSPLFSPAQNRALPWPMAHFLYGREVLRWAPPPTRWLFPRLGALPVNWGRIDRRSARWLYRLAEEGPRPLALAPEGQVTYRLGTTAPIGGGASHLAEHLLNRGQRVTLLPAAVIYHPPKGKTPPPGEPEEGPRFIEEWLRLFQEVRRRFSLDGPPAPPPADSPALREWWRNLMIQLLIRCGSLGEDGGIPLPPHQPSRETPLFPEETIAHMIPLRQEIRLQLRRLRKTSRSPRKVLQEAAHGLEVFDIGEYMDPVYYTAGPAYRLREGLLNLRDLENRLRGGTLGSRQSPPGSRAQIIWGVPREAALDQREQRAQGAQRKEAWNRLIRETLESVSALGIEQLKINRNPVF